MLPYCLPVQTNHRSCKGHIKNGLHITPVSWYSGLYLSICLLQRTVIHESTMTLCTHTHTQRQTYLHHSVWHPPPSSISPLQHAQCFLRSPRQTQLKLEVYSISNTMICILPTGNAPGYPEFFSCASHAFFRWTDRIQTALAEWLLLVCVQCLCVCMHFWEKMACVVVFMCVARRLVLIAILVLFWIITCATPAVWYCRHTHTHTPADFAQKILAHIIFGTIHDIVLLALQMLTVLLTLQLWGSSQPVQRYWAKNTIFTPSDLFKLKSKDILNYMTNNVWSIRPETEPFWRNTMLTFLSLLKTTSMSHPSANVCNGTDFSKSPWDPAL